MYNKNYMNNLLRQCVFEAPCDLQGAARIVELSQDGLTRSAHDIPQITIVANATKTVAAGWYIGVNTLEADRWPKALDEWPAIEGASNTPYNNRKLEAHQCRAVSFLLAASSYREGCILAAEMGLMKTTSALHALWLNGLLYEPGVVVGPLCAAATWLGPEADASKYYGLTLKQLFGMQDVDVSLLANNKHFFLNYELLQTWGPWLQSSILPKWVIFDEIHLLSNPTAKRSKAAVNFALWHSIQCRYGLTGTPISNDLNDLWNQLRIVQPHQWGNQLTTFGCRYNGGKREIAAGTSDDERTFYVYDGPTNTDELQAVLGGTLLWYTKKDVDTSLPVLDRRAEYIDLTQEEREVYEAAAREAFVEIKEQRVAHKAAGEEFSIKNEATGLRVLNKFIGALADLKAGHVPNQVLRLLAHNDKIVIFTWTRAACATIVNALKVLDSAAWESRSNDGLQVFGPIDGAMPQPKRQEAANRFADCNLGVYVATLGAAGMSLNELKCASACLTVSLSWRLDMLLQAESRVYRGGSPHKIVESVFLVARNTVDDLYINNLLEKANITSMASKSDETGLSLVNGLSNRQLLPVAEALDDICSALHTIELEQ